MMNELCLFAGAGGGSIASKWFLNWRTVCYVEIDKYCQQVLQARIRDGLLDDAPAWDDVRTFDGRPWRGCVDIITAGFPCQPFSVAGKRKGADDERNMWPDTIRLIREIRPRYAFLENVPGLLISGYFGTVLGDLAESGYDIRWRHLSAAEVGAPHKRDRLWIMAYASCKQINQQCSQSRKSSKQQGPTMETWEEAARQKNRKASNNNTTRFCEILADSKRKGCNKRHKPQGGQASRCRALKCEYWQVEPDVGRVVYGLAYGVDRLKALGNGQVPQVVKVAWDLLTEEWTE